MNDEEIMALAFEQAKKGIGHTWKNPVVGAIIYKGNRILAAGYHHEYGQMHAEINALSHLNDPDEARNATMYVTLEPCSHFGKTPPCAQKLVNAGIKKVVIGQKDPNPLVAGKGIEILENHGIEVTVLRTSGGINQAYNFFYTKKRPLITLKYAMSLDGKLNYQKGKRTQLTGKRAFQASQTLRFSQQAILIGEKTMEVDNPELTIRTFKTKFPPIRIILVNDADDLSLSAKLFNTKSPVWLLTRKRSTRQWPGFVHVFQGLRWTPQDIIRLLAKKRGSIPADRRGKSRPGSLYCRGFSR